MTMEANPPESATDLPEAEPQPQPQPELHPKPQLELHPEPQPEFHPEAQPEPQALAYPEPPKKDRRRFRGALRWASAVAVFAVVGSGTAYGITRLDRTDVPGLATHADGRWDYPVLVRPPLPSGSPGPNDDARNPAGSHYADLRKLLLPAPRGATADASLKGTDGWLATKTFLKEFSLAPDREDVNQHLTDNGLRHIAARGWTTADGTHTRVYLLQFSTGAVADHVLGDELTGNEAPFYRVRGGEAYERDDAFPRAAEVTDVHTIATREAKPYGAEQVRQAYLASGDTVAVIIQTRKGSALAVPFQQTVTLQAELLA
ncbi:hypothetical protein [Streptomyces sp. NPDC051016]|uniref:hypothetical protein n=1 Tax=Streptomyces sp. NPDC051016 TaxID=3365638 RepID=UPI003787D190